jgi:hypothetical protein
MVPPPWQTIALKKDTLKKTGVRTGVRTGDSCIELEDFFLEREDFLLKLADEVLEREDSGIAVSGQIVASVDTRLELADEVPPLLSDSFEARARGRRGRIQSPQAWRQSPQA